MSGWEEPRRIRIGRDGAHQAINLIQYEDAEGRLVSQIEVGGSAAILLDHLEDGLVKLLRKSLAVPRLARS